MHDYFYCCFIAKYIRKLVLVMNGITNNHKLNIIINIIMNKLNEQSENTKVVPKQAPRD